MTFEEVAKSGYRYRKLIVWTKARPLLWVFSQAPALSEVEHPCAACAEAKKSVKVCRFDNMHGRWGLTWPDARA